jgi:16S rRNA (cytidine1402-2'-O)-methyltransferase
VLILAATPIGNLQDASPRLREALAGAGHIAAEDTRTLKQLATVLGIKLSAKLYSLHDHNELDRVGQLVGIAENEDVLVVSDAGMPTISDPGFLLVRTAAEAGVEIISIPGPSAVITALAVSGLPTDRFCFEGFLPRKSGERKRVFQDLISERRTMIFFEAPHRILESLEDAASVLGPERKASVSRELTKKFEHTERGKLADLIQWAKSEPKGEMVLVISGADAAVIDIEELARKAASLAASGLRLKEACSDLAKEYGASSSAIYSAALKLKA